MTRVRLVVPRDISVPSLAHWHEGATLIGYWRAGGSYLFRGNDGHVLCVSHNFLRDIFGQTPEWLERAGPSRGAQDEVRAPQHPQPNTQEAA